MIEVRRLDGLSCPVMACDQCGGLVEHLGNVLWQDGPGRDRAAAAGPAVLHKAACTRAFEAAHPGPRWQRDELGSWLWQLVRNAQVDLAAAGRRQGTPGARW